MLFRSTNYKNCLFFEKNSDFFKKIYFNLNTNFLSEVNFIFTKKIIEFLDLKINLHKSSDLGIDGDRNTRLLNICNFLNCTHYLSGPSAKCYLDEGIFREKNIKVLYHNYENFKEYKQNWQGFSHSVSILDMFFNLGDETKNYFNETQPI